MRGSIFSLEKVSQMTYYFTKVGNDASRKQRKPGRFEPPRPSTENTAAAIQTLDHVQRQISRPFRDRQHQLRSLAPSVFAGAAHAKVSDRYSFIPTATVVDGLRAEGWAPVWAGEQRIRPLRPPGLSKHMIRLARTDDLKRTQAERPELVLVNSHDRSSAYQLHAGIFRLRVQQRDDPRGFGVRAISIMHVNFEPAKVIEARL